MTQPFDAIFHLRIVDTESELRSGVKQLQRLASQLAARLQQSGHVLLHGRNFDFWFEGVLVDRIAKLSGESCEW